MGYQWTPVAGSNGSLAGVPGSRAPRARSQPTPAEALAVEEAALADVAEEFVAAADDGRARKRDGRRYRPSAVRDLAGLLRNHVVPELGDLRLRDVQPDDLQLLVDELAARGLSLSRTRSVVSAIRALYAYAIMRGLVDVSPADRLDIGRIEHPLSAHEDRDAESWSAARWHCEHDSTRERDWTSRPDRQERGFPEMLLSLALRAIVIVFIIILLASVAQSILVPA
jgi:hypothetical protein